MTDPDALQIRRKRLIYQATHRGTQESDLVIGGFAKKHVPDFAPEQLDAFEALIDAPDSELMDWIGGRATPPERHRGPVLDLIINFKNNLLSN